MIFDREMGVYMRSVRCVPCMFFHVQDRAAFSQRVREHIKEVREVWGCSDRVVSYKKKQYINEY